MTKRKTREKQWRFILFFLIVIEFGIIGLLAFQVYTDTISFPIYQLTGLLFLAIWIYIAFLKQKTVDVSAYALGEKFKTHAIIESIPLGAIILNQENEILIGNAMASSLLGKELMLVEDRDLGHCLPYDIMKTIYSNQWGGYTTKGLEGLLEVIVTVTPVKDRECNTIGKLLIIQGAETQKKNEKTPHLCAELSKVCMTYVSDTEAVLRPARPEVAKGTRMRSLLMKNIIEREDCMANLGKKTEHFGTLSDILVTVITEVKSTYASKKLKIETNLHDKMLVKSPSTFVHVLRELMVNSALFSEEESTVTISSKVEDDFFEIRVRDSGIGMSNDLLAEAFDDKFIGKNSDVYIKYRHGRGLFVVKTLLEEVGVSIRIESKEGAGTLVVMSGQQADIDS